MRPALLTATGQFYIRGEESTDILMVPYQAISVSRWTGWMYVGIVAKRAQKAFGQKRLHPKRNIKQKNRKRKEETNQAKSQIPVGPSLQSNTRNFQPGISSISRCHPRKTCTFGRLCQAANSDRDLEPFRTTYKDKQGWTLPPIGLTLTNLAYLHRNRNAETYIQDQIEEIRNYHISALFT